MILKEQESKFTPVPGGTYGARCISLIGLGTQHDEMYGRTTNNVMIFWEIPELPTESDPKKPMTIFKEYNLSMDQKSTLRKHLQAWRGRDFTAEELKGFDLKNILGKPCLLSVLSAPNATGQIKSKVDSVAQLPKGMPVPEQFHPNTYYSIEQGKDERFKALPEWIQKKISQCREWNKHTQSLGEFAGQDEAGPEAMVDPTGGELVPF